MTSENSKKGNDIKTIYTMVFRYRKDIFDAIIDILMENENGLANLELYEKVVQKLGIPLSKNEIHQIDYERYLNFINFI